MNPTLPAAHQALKRLAMFANVDAVQLGRVADGCRQRAVGRGEFLFHRGSASSSFYGVMTGLMELALTNGDGEKKVLEIIGPGQSLGEAVMFLQRPYPVDARALLDTTLIEVPAATINQLIDDDPRFARAMLASMSLRLHNRVRDIEMFTLATAKQRVVGFLLGQLADQNAQPDTVDVRLGEYVNHVAVADGALPGVGRSGAAQVPPGEVNVAVVTLPTAKATVASRLGMTPETFSRALSALAEEGLLRSEGRHIHINDCDALTTQAFH